MIEPKIRRRDVIVREPAQAFRLFICIRLSPQDPNTLARFMLRSHTILDAR
jgi:hypothetical protein